MEKKFDEREFPEGGTQFWISKIKEAGVYDELRGFNDVITGKDAPRGYADGPVLTDVVLDGFMCDIYHTDGKKGEKTDRTGNRIFIHIKGEPVQE